MGKNNIMHRYESVDVEGDARVYQLLHRPCLLFLGEQVLKKNLPAGKEIVFRPSGIYVDNALVWSPGSAGTPGQQSSSSSSNSSSSSSNSSSSSSEDEQDQSDSDDTLFLPNIINNGTIINGNYYSSQAIRCDPDVLARLLKE